MVIVVVGAYLIWGGEFATAPDQGDAEVTEYQVLVNDQVPHDGVLVERTAFPERGFVVIREDAGGEPGAVIGVSSAIIGATSEFGIVLDRPSEDGEMLYAQLYTDDGNGRFEPSVDTPVTDSEGNPVLNPFSIAREIGF